MEPDKVAKFYSILYAYKGRISKRTYENELYRQERIYNFFIELSEKFDMILMMVQRIFYNFLCPIRTLQISVDRIMSKFAFCPPYDTYVFDFDIKKNKSNFGKKKRSIDSSKRKCQYGEIMLTHFATTSNPKLTRTYQQKFSKLFKYIECFYAFTKLGNRIACIYIPFTWGNKSGDNAKTIVYSHTNAEDIGSMLSHLWRMKRKLRCNIFAYDYSGYGMSSGSPSQRNLYADVQAAVEELFYRKNLKPKDIILFGESIGSVPTIYMATRIKAYGVILQSSFMSAIRIYLPYKGPSLLFDPFPNIERVPNIRSKTLVIHGTDDMLVDISHAVAIYRALKYPVTPFWVNGASHMSMHKHVHYYERICYFIEVEISK